MTADSRKPEKKTSSVTELHHHRERDDTEENESHPQVYPTLVTFAREERRS
jgi:hypothetical protein